MSDSLSRLSSSTIGPPLANSDHRSVSASIQCCEIPSTKVYKNVYDLRPQHVRNFVDSVSSIDFQSIITSSASVHEKCNLFQSSITDCFENHIPCCAVPVSNRDKPWITPFVKHLIHERWLAYRKRNFTRYRKLAGLVKSKIAAAKHKWANQAANVNQLWKKAHSVIGTKDSDPLYCLSTSFSSTIQFVNAINDHFTSAFVESSPIKLNSSACSNYPSLDISFTIDDVHQAITAYPSNKACGADKVTTHLYKLIADIIADPLCHIFNLSLDKCIFPNCWKSAKVVAVPKCKNPSIKDLRPISLLPFCSKIFEKIFYEKTKDIFIKNFGPYQYGFRPHSSTCHALIAVHNYITLYCDDARSLGVELVAFDFSKAFDSLKYDVIVNRLLACNFPMNIVKWLLSYLLGRTQFVSYGNSMSVTTSVSSGVPQGSVIGPALFALLMGDLSPIHATTGLFVYADDVTVCIPTLKYSHNVSDEVDNIRNWSNKVYLTLNNTKCKSMYFKCSNLGSPVCNSLSIPIENVSSLKLLGVIFSCNLHWDNHIDYLSKIVHTRLYALRVLKPSISRNSLIYFYCQFIRSLFDYCCPLFVSLNDKNCCILRRLQRRCHNLICGFHCTRNCLPDLSSRRLTIATHLYYKAYLNPSDMLHKLIPTRRNKRFCQPVSKFSRRYNSFIPYTTDYINSNLL